MKNIPNYLIGLLLTVGGPLLARTGPGGVGNPATNGIWLRADNLNLNDGDAVATWPDGSGNGNDARQTDPLLRPQYLSASALNNRPAVRLDGNDDRLLVADADILDGTAGITYFAVVRPRNLDGEPRGILGKRIDQGVRNITYAYTWFFFANQYLNLDVSTQDDRFTTDPVTYNNLENYILGWQFDGSQPQNTRSSILANGQTVKTAPDGSTTVNDSQEPLTIGALNDNYRVYLGADYAEIIHFNYALSSLDRILVINYLSGKYAIPLSNGDIYVQDDPTQGNFDNDIAGIGRLSATDLQTDSRGSGIVRVNAPSDLNDDEFMFWGHDGGNLTQGNSGDLPSGVASRLDRTWRVSERSSAGSPIDVGAVDLTFDLSSIPPVVSEDLRLLVDTDNDGTFADESPVSGATANGNDSYTFSGVTGLQDGSRFTLGEGASALPGRLHDFEARWQPEGNIVLEWVVFEESLRDYFAIEWSAEGRTWREIGRTYQVPASRYSYRHATPSAGPNYYRVRQVDFDGTYSLSPVRLVHVEATEGLRAFPNPFRASFTILHSGQTVDGLSLLAADGREVTQHCEIQEMGNGRIHVVTEGLPPGVYVGRWPDGREIVVVRR